MAVIVHPNENIDAALKRLHREVLREKVLEDALNCLPEKCRIIFSMKRFGEMSNNEIAKKLNISNKTVENQTTIAIKKLTSYVNNHWDNTSLILFNFLFRKNII